MSVITTFRMQYDFGCHTNEYLFNFFKMYLLGRQSNTQGYREIPSIHCLNGCNS